MRESLRFLTSLYHIAEWLAYGGLPPGHVLRLWSTVHHTRSLQILHAVVVRSSIPQKTAAPQAQLRDVNPDSPFHYTRLYFLLSLRVVWSARPLGHFPRWGAAFSKMFSHFWIVYPFSEQIILDNAQKSKKILFPFISSYWPPRRSIT